MSISHSHVTLKFCVVLVLLVGSAVAWQAGNGDIRVSKKAPVHILGVQVVLKEAQMERPNRLRLVYRVTGLSTLPGSTTVELRKMEIVKGNKRTGVSYAADTDAEAAGLRVTVHAHVPPKTPVTGIRQQFILDRHQKPLVLSFENIALRDIPITRKAAGYTVTLQKAALNSDSPVGSTFTKPWNSSKRGKTCSAVFSFEPYDENGSKPHGTLVVAGKRYGARSLGARVEGRKLQMAYIYPSINPTPKRFSLDVECNRSPQPRDIAWAEFSLDITQSKR